MALTGQLGTPQSQPGALQCGYAPAGIAVWHGPFTPPEIVAYELVGGQLTVPLAVASQLALSDSTWWTFH